MQHTPIYHQHVALGGQIVEFGGWALPLQYTGILKEHETVRTALGLFDVSHMGEITVKGALAQDFMQKLVTGDIAKLKDKQVLYSLMCYEDGGVVDDLLVYKQSAEDFLLVVNAANTDQDYAWIKRLAPSSLEVKNESSAIAQLALQGPLAQATLQTLTNFPLDAMGFFHFEPHIEVAGIQALVSRTGYTGEDGFELYLSSEDAPTLWSALLLAGAPFGIVPVGLGARDTLRFEAGLALYGHELTRDITPLEANLAPFVKLKKEVDFVGKNALIAQKKSTVPRELIGVAMIERGIPRHGCDVVVNGNSVGHITSGTFSPTRKENLGLALVARDTVGIGDEVSILVRGKYLQAKRIGLPFYEKKYKKTPVQL
ncbi:MAG: glycine cleavage system aminomethyltransferase GcvT [Thermaerobacter sp.]|nr:glycine cleavage system aminomethyltransferase GcvT [Thermaerobacter sp.]